MFDPSTSGLYVYLSSTEKSIALRYYVKESESVGIKRNKNKDDGILFDVTMGLVQHLLKQYFLVNQKTR